MKPLRPLEGLRLQAYYFKLFHKEATNTVLSTLYANLLRIKLHHFFEVLMIVLEL
jgi:hypothetical protein